VKLHVFHGMGKDDEEKHWFTCEATWSMKRITNDISHMLITFRDRALTSYMK
jgi:hypothetical protein